MLGIWTGLLKKIEAGWMASFDALIISREEEIVEAKVVDDFKLKIRMGHIGSLRMELIEPMAGKRSICKDVLDNKGEDIHHFVLQVDDIDEAKAAMIKKGLNLFLARFKKNKAVAYFASYEFGGFALELLQPPR